MVQVIGIGIVIKIETGSRVGTGIRVGIEKETWIVKGLGSMMVEIEMEEEGWILG